MVAADDSGLRGDGTARALLAIMIFNSDIRTGGWFPEFDVRGPWQQRMMIRNQRGELTLRNSKFVNKSVHCLNIWGDLLPYMLLYGPVTLPLRKLSAYTQKQDVSFITT